MMIDLGSPYSAVISIIEHSLPFGSIYDSVVAFHISGICIDILLILIVFVFAFIIFLEFLF